MASKLPLPRRLVAFDLDGTVLHNGQPMTHRTTSVLEAAHAKGCLLVVSTGRSWETLPPGLAREPYLDYLSLSNGSQLRKAGSGEYLLSRPMPAELTLELMGLFPASWYVFLEDALLFEWGTLTGRLSNRPSKLSLREMWCTLRSCKVVHNAAKSLRGRGLPPVSKLESLFPDQESRAAAVKQFRLRGDVEIVTTTGLDLEITAAGVNKGSAITLLAERHGISKEHIFCFGDSSNDLSMACAGTFIAMGNADDEVKAAAHGVTLPVWEDGFAAWLEPWVVAL